MTSKSGALLYIWVCFLARSAFEISLDAFALAKNEATVGSSFKRTFREGRAEIKALVYSFFGALKTLLVRPCSTIFPLYITSVRFAISETKARS